MKRKENHFVIIYEKEGKEEEERKKEKKKNGMKQGTDEQKQMIRKDAVSWFMK